MSDALSASAVMMKVGDDEGLLSLLISYSPISSSSAWPGANVGLGPYPNPLLGCGMPAGFRGISMPQHPACTSSQSNIAQLKL